MKKNCWIILVLVLISVPGIGQDKLIDNVIRELEQRECKAVLAKDTATLRKLWADDYTVHSPANRIVTGGKNTLDRPVINQANNISFVRNVEHILVKGDCAFAMGNEEVVPVLSNGAAGGIIKRRYTNVWMKESGEWKLAARHANVICQ